jgi:uncharacterized membrane protein YsdA (DUF1294 family)
MKLLLNPASIKSTILYLLLTAAATFFINDYTKNEISYIYAWFLSVNAVLIMVMAKDKFAAIINISRTPEGALLWLAFAGGFPGLFIARFVFRHKSSKAEFIRPMYIMLALQILAIIYYFVKIDTSF